MKLCKQLGLGCSSW